MSARGHSGSRAGLRTWVGPLFKAIGNARCRTWDFIHGVDTSGEIPLVDLEFESEQKTAGLEYQSHHPAIIRDVLSSVDIRHQDFTFVDIGCGKGRVLLVASEFPFRKIIGIEFAPQLAEAARKNIASYRGNRRRCLDIEVVTADATVYELAPEPQILYFYSPFAPVILNQVIDKIEDSWQKAPRELLVLFSGIVPMRDIGFGSRPQFERLQRGRYFDLYRRRPR